MSSTLPPTRVAPAQPPMTQSFFLSSDVHPSTASVKAFLLRNPASVSLVPLPSRSRATPVAMKPIPCRPWSMSFWMRSAP